MKTINPNGIGLDRDGCFMLTLLMCHVWSAQIVGNKMLKLFNDLHFKGTVVHDKKFYLKQATQACQQMLNAYEQGFDDPFNSVFARHGARGTETIQQLSNELIQLCIIYLARVEGEDDDKGERLRKALLNFKPVDNDIDAEGIMNLFRMKK